MTEAAGSGARLLGPAAAEAAGTGARAAGDASGARDDCRGCCNGILEPLCRRLVASGLAAAEAVMAKPVTGLSGGMGAAAEAAGCAMPGGGCGGAASRVRGASSGRGAAGRAAADWKKGPPACDGEAAEAAEAEADLALYTRRRGGRTSSLVGSATGEHREAAEAAEAAPVAGVKTARRRRLTDRSRNGSEEQDDAEACEPAGEGEASRRVGTEVARPLRKGTPRRRSAAAICWRPARVSR